LNVVVVDELDVDVLEHELTIIEDVRRESWLAKVVA